MKKKRNPQKNITNVTYQCCFSFMQLQRKEIHRIMPISEGDAKEAVSHETASFPFNYSLLIIDV